MSWTLNMSLRWRSRERRARGAVRGRSVARVELDLGFPQHGLPVLDEKRRPGPSCIDSRRCRRAPGDVVRTEPRRDGVAGSEVDRRCRGRRAARRRPGVGACASWPRAGRPGTRARRSRRRPAFAFHRRTAARLALTWSRRCRPSASRRAGTADAVRDSVEREPRRVFPVLRQRARRREELLLSPRRLVAACGQARSLRRGREDEVRAAARANGVDEVPRLDVHRSDRVDDLQSAPEGVKDVEAHALLGGELSRRGGLRAAQHRRRGSVRLDPRGPQERGVGDAPTDRRQDAPSDDTALLDATGGDELGGRGALEIESLEGGRSLRCEEVRARGLVRVPRPLGGLGDPAREPDEVGRVRGRGVERPLKEAGGLRERQLVDGLLGGTLGVLRGTGRVAGAGQVRGDGFGIRVGRCLEQTGERGVVRARRLGREMRHDRLADAVVERLDHLAALAKARAHEPPPRSKAIELRGQRLGARGDADERHGERAAAHRDDLEQAPRVGGQARRTLVEDLVERDRRWPAALSLRARRCRAVAPRVSSSIKNGLPPASSAMASAISWPEACCVPRSAPARRARVLEGERFDLDLADLGVVRPSRAAGPRERGSPPTHPSGASSPARSAARRAAASPPRGAPRCRCRPTARRR